MNIVLSSCLATVFTQIHSTFSCINQVNSGRRSPPVEMIQSFFLFLFIYRNVKKKIDKPCIAFVRRTKKKSSYLITISDFVFNLVSTIQRSFHPKITVAGKFFFFIFFLVDFGANWNYELWAQWVHKYVWLAAAGISRQCSASSQIICWFFCFLLSSSGLIQFSAHRK